MNTLAAEARGGLFSRGAVRQALALVVLCAAAAVASVVLRPTQQISTFGQQKLGEVIPEKFGDWALDRSVVPVLPDPSVSSTVNRIYSEVVARTYINSRGERVMMSLAYGRRQDDTMRVHQPEGCYAGQGFAVTRVGRQELATAVGSTPVMRLFTQQGMRKEPVTYWTVIGGQHALSQWEGKLAQLSFGVRGFIPDGLLVRVSTISPDAAAGFKVQDEFVRQLLASLPAAVAAGMTGR